ncbi:MAG TPA: hypothetical protein VND91_07615 [Candidatus Saccharimonadia bacterium]|nr:hypothetical protein [Candidatus Saccharimonadia bacterium]
MRLIAVAFSLFAGLAHGAVEPFFAPPVPVGTLTVRLHPTEVVLPGNATRVTFGVPFPRGSLTAAQLSTLRVLRGGIEIPAHVEMLTPWRHRTNAAIDGQSVRVALVQVEVAFASAFPSSDTIVVEWGTTPRTLDVPSRQDPRSAWHLVTTGTFVASDAVMEPDVYAVLPAAWLSQGLLKPSRTTAFADPSPAARDDPAVNDAIATWPGFEESERAFKNNFFSVINRDDPAVTVGNQCPYKTVAEPWLYDRAATMFVLHFRSGGFDALREATRATQFYANRLDANGFFTLAPSDSKYAYNESLAYAYWLTGDVALAERIGRVVVAHAGYPHVWTAQRNFWTERHAAFKLLANVVAYEVAGSTTHRDAVESILAAFRAHQDGAGGVIPANRIDGGLYHTGTQHSGDWAASSYGASSWMTALLTDAAVRAYATGEDAATAQFLVRAARFLDATTITTTANSYDSALALALPRYAMLADGSDAQVNTDDVEHALDVAGQIAWGAYFSGLAGAREPALVQGVADLYATYDVGVNFWIRPAGPSAGNTAFRVSPWRKWGWEHRTSDALRFAMTDAPATLPLFADGFE